MSKGRDYFTSKNYDKALREFQAAQVSARECNIQTKDAGLQVQRVFNAIIAQKKEAEDARIQAEKQKAIAENKTREAVAQKVANQNQLARIYWSNSQSARNDDKILEALHFTAEALLLCKDEDLRQNLLIDIEHSLPNFSLNRILNIPDYYFSFNADGTKILSPNGSWDVATGKQLDEMAKPVSQYRWWVISADRKKVLSSVSDNAVHLWDAITGKQIGDEIRHNGIVDLAVFSPDETRILTTDSDSIVYVWDALTSTQIYALKHSGDVNSAVFNRNGTQILSASDDGTCRLWDALNGTPVGSFMKHWGGVSSAVFSNDEQFILTTGLDNTARIWDAVTQKQKGPDMKHAGGVNSVVLSRKNELALTAGNDDDVKIWNLLSTDSIPLKAVPRTLSLPAGWEPVDGVGRAVFSPNENQILGAVGVYSKDRSLAFDTAFFLQNLASGQSPTQISTNSKFARHVSFSPDGKQLLTLESDGVAFVRNGVTGSLVNPALKHEGSILSALFSPDGKDILTESPGGSGSYRGSVVRIWNAAKEKAKNDFITLNGRVESIRTAVFSPDSKKILTISFQTSGQLWDAATGTTKGPSLEHKSQIMSAVFSADNKYLLTTGFDSIARVWYAETGLPVGKPFNHNGGLAAAVFGKNNRQIITVTLDGKVYSGDIETGALVEYPSTGKPPLKTGIAGAIGQQLLLPGIRLTDHLSEVIFGKELADTIKKKAFLLRKFYFNPNGKQAAILRTPTRLYILSISNQNESGKVIEHDKRINTVSFSPGGKSMLTTSDDGTARLWDCRTGRQIGPSMIHKGAVIAAAFSPDGKRIVTAGTDNAARLWEANTGKQIGVFDGRFTNGTSNIGDVVYSPDGKHILIIDMSGFEKMWKIPGDLDIPSDLFKLQMQVTTGVQLNLQTNELEIIPAKAWYKLKSEYEKKAEEHSARCKHPEYNLWKRFQVP